MSTGSLQGVGRGTKTQKVRAMCDFLKTFLIMKVTYKKRNRKVERKQKSSIILFLRNKNPVNTIYSMFLLKN